MSELREYLCIEAKKIEREDFLCYRFISATKSAPEACMEPVYIKHEADKFIADLEESHKKEVGQLLILNREQANAANRLRDSIEQSVQHQKYKRCLYNAWWCLKLSNVYALIAYTHRGWKIAGYYDEKAEFYRKWRERWLKIAEQFKEIKNAED